MKSKRKHVRERNGRATGSSWLCITCATVNKLSDRTCSGRDCTEKKPKKPGER